MIALVFLVLSLLFGTSVLRKTSLKLHVFELSCAGLVLGSFVQTWLVFIGAGLLGFPVSILLTLILIAVATVVLQMGKKQPLSFPRFSKKDLITYIIFTLVWFSLLLPLFISHMFERKNDGLYSGGGAWGDLALHATFVERFAQQTKLDLTSPIYSLEKTTYPLLFDIYASILLRYGFSLQASLVLSGILFTLAFLQLSYFFVIRITKSHAVAALFTILFFFNGGVGVWYAVQDLVKSGQPLLKFLFSMQVEYAHLAVYGLHWSNIIADYILPQRAFLAGLPVFVMILFVLRSLWFAREDHPDQRLLLVFLVGMLPLFHTHTFLVSIGMLGFFIPTDIILRKRHIRAWIFPLLLLIALSAPQMWWQFGHTFGKGFTRLQYGWMKENENIIIFWIRNMGMEALFFIIGGIYFLLFEKKQHFVKILFIPLAILFFITNVIVFQPHDYDNMKLMIYSHFAITLVTSLLLASLWKKRTLGKLLVFFLFISLTITGALSILRESYTSWQIATYGGIQMAEKIKEKTSPYSIFLTADSHNHTVTMLAGRAIVMGYRGWLWTHGINYAKTENDVTRMFHGEDDTPALLTEYRVSYVFIGPAEISDFGADDAYFKARYPIVFQNNVGTVYDVRGTPLPSVATKKS